MRIMFERRLKLVLALLFVMTAVLVLRAAQLQIVNRHHWSEAAAEALKREQPIETTRGTIYDVNKVPIAQDVACIDACVDYRAIADPPDDAWVSKLALQWSRERRGDEYKVADSARRKQILEEEKAHVLNRIDVLWATLAQVGNKEREAIEETRHEIIRRVEMRRRYVWYRKYELAREAHEQKKNSDDAGTTSWWKQWLIDETQEAPQLDQFEVKVAEQTAAHPILRAISPDVQNQLGKASDDLPGLVLRPGMTRTYPWGEAACHTIGHLSRVRREDLEGDPYSDDDLRKYQYNDLIGRSGLEALCEPLLRGSRGRIERYIGSNEDEEKVLDTKPPVPGTNIASTIDIALQQEILGFFQNAEVVWNERPPEPPVRRHLSMHGGAVVIDVRSGQVRALVSNPTFDLNKLDDQYATLAERKLERPLISRATQYPLETGSTIKPVVGIGAITQGVASVNEGIECTGFLVIGGRRYSVGRCWVASKFINELGVNGVAHHPIPTEEPHRGHDGNPDGFLTFSDALQRSCNVYFETLASRLGMDGLSYWMERFGLGRPTGIGIEEARGRLPNSYQGANAKFATWIAGIGQGPVAATPLQMCNVAATIARDGIWMRPTLLTVEDSGALRRTKVAMPATTQSSGVAIAFTSWRDVPDRVDLKVSPAALNAAHEGMFKVVNTRGGTGTALHSTVVTVAGKTGTAQAARFTMPACDEHGKPILDEDNRQVNRAVQPTTVDAVSQEAPWYVAFGEDGKNLKHSWIIGYAPANNPQVAFAVMVEYGGSGGQTAAAIAKATLDACIQHGYLSPDHPAGGMTARVKSE
jgi:penicillin-binding protein 2